MALSEEECLQAREVILELCTELGIVVSLEKSHLCLSQVATYLGIVFDSSLLKASLSVERQRKLFLIIEFLSSERQPILLWRALLGHLFSLTQLVLGDGGAEDEVPSTSSSTVWGLCV